MWCAYCGSYSHSRSKCPWPVDNSQSQEKKTEALISPWTPTTDPLEAKLLGKLNEEGGELISAAARCYIQGINESEPVTKKPNRLWLMEEIADVQAASELVTEHFELDRDFIAARKAKKMGGLRKWHQMVPLN